MFPQVFPQQRAGNHLVLLNSTDKLDKSLGGINERIAVLEACATHDNQTHRINVLE
jgi:hypothetical protein